MLPKEERKGSPNVVGKTPEIRRQKRIKGELEVLNLRISYIGNTFERVQTEWIKRRKEINRFCLDI